MTLDEAKQLVREGQWFGVVWPMVDPADQQEFRDWFVHTPTLPVAVELRPEYRGRKPATARPAAKGLTGHHPTPGGKPDWNGNGCGRCGGLMVQTGKCATCQDCGESDGGCS